MAKKQHMIAGVSLRPDRPTSLAFERLFTWVIWQFPRREEVGLCGAVKPAIAEHGWYPAVIFNQEQRLELHGHLGKTFPTPEEAAHYLLKNDKKPASN